MSLWRVGPGRLLGALLLAVMLLTAAIAPALPLADPLRQDLGRGLEPPGAGMALGTDHLGRSLAARLVFGARTSVGIALAATLVAVVLGGAVGVLGAVAPSPVRGAVLLVADTALALPGFLAALLIAGALPSGFGGLVVAIAATHWGEPCRVGLLAARRAVGAPHVEAARLAGLPRVSIALRLVAPAVLSPLAGIAGLMVGQAVLIVAGLGFLGVGLRPPTPEWGAMIVDGLPYLDEAPLLVAAPALAIVCTTVSVFLLVAPRSYRQSAA